MPAAVVTRATARSRTAAARVACHIARTASAAIAKMDATTLADGRYNAIDTPVAPANRTASASPCTVPAKLGRRRARTRKRQQPRSCSSMSVRTCSHPQRPIETLRSRSRMPALVDVNELCAGGMRGVLRRARSAAWAVTSTIHSRTTARCHRRSTAVRPPARCGATAQGSSRDDA